MILLKDFSETADLRLARCEQFDIRSREFPISTETVDKKHRSYTWRCSQVLNQGSEGSCVGHGVSHELIARPSEVRGLSHETATRLYHDAQKIDRWPGGSYNGASPFYEGTSVLAGVKIAHKSGWFDEYRWAFSLEDLILGVGHNGPAVLGVGWFRGMYVPASDGYIHVTGEKQGGHCVLCNAVSVREQRFTLTNSWGRVWGMNGSCYISFSDMERLLNERGEAVFFIHRHRGGTIG